MTRPAQKVILYTGGIREVQGRRSMERNMESAKYRGVTTQCNRCKRYLKFPENNHLSDPKNKTPCLGGDSD